ncbi:MAG: ribosomal protein S18-alanine N-acetyltransferase [Candidatus Bathyarchaeia archaeon]
MNFLEEIKINVRLFKMEDLQKVYEIECESFLFPWQKFVFRYYHWRNPEGFFVATKNGEIVGYAITEIAKHGLEKHGHLLNLAVKPSFRRKKVGTALMEAVFNYLAKESVEDLWLEVRISNLVARSFYSKLGFKENGKIWRYYLNEDAIKMVKRLKR